MAVRFFIGDKVRTKWGIGYVRRVTPWRKRIIDMNDAEAKEFCAICKLEVGMNFKEDWVELLVAVGKSLRRVQAKNVEMVEGRDEDVAKAMERTL